MANKRKCFRWSQYDNFLLKFIVVVNGSVVNNGHSVLVVVVGVCVLVCFASMGSPPSMPDTRKMTLVVASISSEERTMLVLSR